MAETVPGGRYLSDDGKTWHDANRKALDAPEAEGKKPAADKSAGKKADADKTEAEGKG